MSTIVIIVTGWLGLCLGNFTHLVVSRYSPTQTSHQFFNAMILQRSHCPKCESQLTWFSLIPVISWLMQQGKCHSCAAPIAIHYLLAELFFAIICMLIVSYYGICLWSIILILLTIIFTILIIIDYVYLLLPDSFNYSILLLGMICAAFELGRLNLMEALCGSIFGLLLLGLPSLFYYLLTKRIGLGSGDIKLLVALGSWLECHQLPILLIIACTLGLIHFCIIKKSWIKSFKKHTINQMTAIPFGPYLLIAGYGLLIC